MSEEQSTPIISSDVTPAMENHMEYNKGNQDVYTNQDPSNTQEGEWELAEGIKGVGPIPDWYNKKTYKYAIDQAKAHHDLRKTLGDVPSEYKMDLGEEYKDEQIPQDDPLLTKFTDFAKENKITQKNYNETIKMWLDYKKDFMKGNEELLAQQKKELEAIGPDAKQKISELTEWATQNFGEDIKSTMENMLQTKADYDFFCKIRDNNGYSKVSNNTSSTSTNKNFELRNMIGDKRYGTDIDYTNHVDKHYKSFYG